MFTQFSFSWERRKPLRARWYLTFVAIVILAGLQGCLPAETPQQSSQSSSSSSTPVFSSSSRSSSSSAPANQLTLPKIQQGCNGYATRFWDCCKPHCGWSGNLPMGMQPNNSCGPANEPLNDINAGSACGGGNAHTCHQLIPFTMSETVAYGWAATQSGDICGRCYQIDFTGESHNSPNDPGSKALANKSMIVQALNIGGDVANGQFDILIPGGGVGLFDACTNQWRVNGGELGAQYGGFLSACKDELGFDRSLSDYKSCVVRRCNNVFGSRGLTDLEQGCLWFADWFEAADNPALKYKEVKCPTELINRSGMDRTFLNDISNRCGN